jgi:hypothetical protein
MSAPSPTPTPAGSLLRASSGILIIFALAGAAYFLTGEIESFNIPGQLGPAFWPKMAIFFLMVSCVVKFIEVYKAWRKGQPTLTVCPGKVSGGRLLAMILALFVAVLLMEIIGFALANFLFIGVFLWLAGLRKPWRLILVSGLGTVGLLYLFVKVVYLPLPKGTWFFDDLTILLYRALFIL